MPLIPFPNIPAVPGVPDIPRLPGSINEAVQITLGAAQGFLYRLFQVETQWGIFDSSGKALGDPAILSGFIGSLVESVGIGSTLSTGTVDFVKEVNVADFPLERGSFASYNKVERPANPVVQLRVAGSERDRRKFLEDIDAACKSTDLYSIVTPEVTYLDYSIERYNYSRRDKGGVTMLAVDISLREVRQVSASFATSQRGEINQPQSSSASPTVDNGKVQAATPDKSTLAKLASKLPSLNSITDALIKGM